MEILINWRIMTAAMLVAVTASSSNAFAAQKFFKPFMPPNVRYLLGHREGGITQAQFDSVVKNTTDKYQAIAAAHGANLVVSADWSDDTVNASADQDGTTWNLHFYGGLARQPSMTSDGMALVICHELGHHFGGYPFFSDPDSGWGAVEGQADYYSADACAKYVWKNDTKRNAAAAKQVPAFAKSKCDAVYTAENDRNICYRTANAGMALALVLADGTGVIPAFEKPDPTVVTQTNEDHPEAQCRLDTYFRAALCSTAFDLSVIPGKDNPSGEQSLDAQKEAFKYSCSKENQPDAARPACWFAEL